MRIKDAHADLMSTMQESATKIHDRLDELDARTYAIGVGMTEWNPQLTDEQLNRILATREPLSIPQHAALLVADVARYGVYTYRMNIGCGSFIGTDWSLKPDGTIVAIHPGWLGVREPGFGADGSCGMGLVPDDL